MEEPCNSREVTLKYLETGLIVGFGMYLHLNQISIIELKYSKLPGLQPNSASAVFTFSVLCVLAVVRPYWPSVLKKPPRILRLILELALTLYLTDLILRQVWVPILRALAYMCTFLSQYMVILNRDLFYSKIPTLSAWMRDEFFYIMRMVTALAAFFFMSEVTGLSEIAKEYYKKIIGDDIQRSTGGRGVRKMESQSRHMTRRIRDNEGTTAVPIKQRKRKRSKSLTRRRPKIQFDHEPMDIYC